MVNRRIDQNKTNHAPENSRIEYEKSLASRNLIGLFKAEVVATKDNSRSGRIQVFVPSLDGSRSNTNSYIDCGWSSPFAGVTDVEGLGEDITDYVGTQKSYGMWMVPPDNGNLVLIAFADSNPSEAFIVSCIFPDKLGHMTPGIPAGKSYSDPSVALPVAEKNRRDEKATHNDATRPAHIDLARALIKQGLINDPLRGAGSSGSRRESPSEVFGILTPGPRDPKNVNHRLGGHQFIMDDKLTSSLIRLRSRQGNQLLLDDTTGSIYMINSRGNAWFELAANGDINMYSDGSINMRSEGNLNLRSDKNINIEAGQNIHMKAAGDRLGTGDYAGINELGALGLPPLGVGGNIRFEAAGELTGVGTRNVALTSVGGDMDFSAAGRVANSGAKFDVLTTGGTLLDPLGGISMLALTGAFQVIAATGATLTSAAPVSLLGSMVLLNSGSGAIPLPAKPAIPAPQIGTNKFKDSPVKEAEFKEPGSEADADVSTEGEDTEGSAPKTPEPIAPTAGQRTGKQDEIKTIVTAMPTKEPYQAHAQDDPIKASEKKPAPDKDLEEKLPDGADKPDATTPNDVVTPGGSLVGTGYKDKDGNVLTGISDATSTATDLANKGVSGAQAVLDAQKDPAKALTDAADAVLGGNPVYDEALGILNNFSTMNASKLLEIMGLGGLIAGIKAALPPIRFPTSNALMEKVIGLQKELTALQAQLNQFGLDQLGFDMSLLEGELGAMKGIINDAIAVASDATDLARILEENGITMPVDGEMIFQDKYGNKIVDFSGGIGPVGATLGLVADLNETYSQIADDITVPLHENGRLALTSFANSIGTESFAGSRLAEYVNNPAQHRNVGREMQKWILDKPGGVIDPVLVGRRQYESQLWQSPDEMDTNFQELPDGGVPWNLLADMLKSRREEFYVMKTSQDGPPTT